MTEKEYKEIDDFKIRSEKLSKKEKEQ